MTEILTFPALGFKAYRTISCQSLNLVDKKIHSEILAILFASSKLTKSLGLDINQRGNYLSDFFFLTSFFENNSNFDDVKEKHGRIFRSTDETVLIKVHFFLLFTTTIYQRTV